MFDLDGDERVDKMEFLVVGGGEGGWLVGGIGNNNIGEGWCRE